MTIEGLLSHPQRLLIVTLLVLTSLAWVQLFDGGPAALLGFNHAQVGHGVAQSTWGLRDFGIVVLMWFFMAVAMMLPTAAPAILSFADIAHAGYQTKSATGRIAVFVLGYLSAWWGFGLFAAATQSGLATGVLYLRAFNAGDPLLRGTVLACAGIFQFSTLKAACLRQCRSPMAFFLAHWRDGTRGAMYLGLRHGTYCIGCCWALMALMLYAGAMSIAWTAGLTALMLAEKIAPAGRTVAHAAGVALLACGGGLIAFAFLRGQIP
jgi:predicted metal-binding membrane protein